MKTLGFIGCGNMARPIIRSAAGGVCDPCDIYVYDTNTELLSGFCAETGVRAASCAAECAACDAVVLAVKPQVFPDVLPLIADTVRQNGTLVISIAAGRTTDHIAGYFDFPVRVARIFPNLNATVGAAVSAYTANAAAAAADLEFVGRLTASFGQALPLDEADFPAFGVLGGCAPAYTFMFIDALYKAGLARGLDEDTARRAAVGVVLGSAKLLSESGGAFDEWVKKVCSPGGTTIEGVNSLNRDGLDAVVARAFDCSYNRDLELSGKA